GCASSKRPSRCSNLLRWTAFRPGCANCCGSPRNSIPTVSTGISGSATVPPELAAQVQIPVRFSLGAHERVWEDGPAALAEVAALFTAAPLVAVHEQT